MLPTPPWKNALYAGEIVCTNQQATPRCPPLIGKDPLVTGTLITDSMRVFTIQLDHQGNPPSNGFPYFRLPFPKEPFVVRLVAQAGTWPSLGATLHVKSPNGEWNSHQLPFSLHSAIAFDIPITRSGLFEFFFEYEAVPAFPYIEKSTHTTRSLSAFLHVAPEIIVKKRSSVLQNAQVDILPENTVLPLNGIVVQTIVAKWMGPIDQWMPHIQLSSCRGYNAVHFPPLQLRGSSNSPYSIQDQLEFDDTLFSHRSLSSHEKLDIIHTTVKDIADLGMCVIADVVWNHTAENSVWLKEHPEAGFNIINSPHLQIALEIDDIIVALGEKVVQAAISIKSQNDIDNIISMLKKDLVEADLWQYYVLDVEHETQEFSKAWVSHTSSSHVTEISDLIEPFIKQALPSSWGSLGNRFGTHVNVHAAVSLMQQLTDDRSPPVHDYKRLLDLVNLPKYREYDDDISSILQNTADRIRYLRTDPNGPQQGPITKDEPLVENLFTRVTPDRHFALANNGWTWSNIPDAAGPHCKVYTRRELMAWTDCVKLRYGQAYDDSPWLWDHMAEYTMQSARLFSGIRLDNCHSTPQHVAQFLLDKARQVNPEIYICAELFTGNVELDRSIVCNLGIHSLIRETMNSHSPEQEAWLVSQYGTETPLGSLAMRDIADPDFTHCTIASNLPKSSDDEPEFISSTDIHALLMDCTHDNESPSFKRTAQDAQPTGALTASASCAIGSVKGFDDLYPEKLDIVHNTQLYRLEDIHNGIGHVKSVLNHLHVEFVDAEASLTSHGDLVISHRMLGNKGYAVIARTAFPDTYRTTPQSVSFPGFCLRQLMAQSIEIPDDQDDSNNFIHGLKHKITPISLEIQDSCVVLPPSFVPGAVAILLTEASVPPLPSHDEIKERLSILSFPDLNQLLYRCDAEERETLNGDSTYAIPGMASLKYAGVQGFFPHVEWIILNNALSHPLCEHIRDGFWAFDFIHQRLQKLVDSGLSRLKGIRTYVADWVDSIRTIPVIWRPKYFAALIHGLSKVSQEILMDKMDLGRLRGNTFALALAATACQMYGTVPSASLVSHEQTPALAAGLPHFAVSWARTWGRDTFITLPGLFVVTGLNDIVDSHLEAFGMVRRNGLIPNLLDSGRTPRYNSRDSPWWMLKCIQDYASGDPKRTKAILEAKHIRIPTPQEFSKVADVSELHNVNLDDDLFFNRHFDLGAYPSLAQFTSTIQELIQDILQSHADGIHFREFNAGPQLDSQMTDRGFNIDIDVDWETGFIHGGNEWNCGTWMDKMGESTKAHNKGVPGSPRNGAPVEITGLLYSVLRWLDKLHASRLYPHSGVTRHGMPPVTFNEWANLIKTNFERVYRTSGFYKDVAGSGAADDKIRPNVAVALSAAPDLFDPEHAREALETFSNHLLGPLGVKTLDPRDPDYRGDYDNGNDSDDFAVAKGRNYHNGPEWLWPLGYFLEAVYAFWEPLAESSEDLKRLKRGLVLGLSEHREYIMHDEWGGLPELTNAEGALCRDSSPTQAWSTATLLHALISIAGK